MDNSSASASSTGDNHVADERFERSLSRNHSESTVRSISSRGCVERGDSLHSLGSQLPAPKTTRPAQRSTWNSRNLSERSLLSTTSSILTAPILEGDDEETMMLVEKLQNEEIMQRVLEQSVTETSGSSGIFSNQKEISIPMFIHDSAAQAGTNAVCTREEPPCFEFSRGIELNHDCELYELDPRHSPVPSKKWNPPEAGASQPLPTQRKAVESEMLDLRISDRSPQVDCEKPLIRRISSGRGIPQPTSSSRSLRSVGSQQSVGSHHKQEYHQSSRSIRSDCRSVVPLIATSTPNTPQRSLPGAVSVPTPASLSKNPEVRAAIERFVTAQPIEALVDSDAVSEKPNSIHNSSGSKNETSKPEASKDPVEKYKYKPKADSSKTEICTQKASAKSEVCEQKPAAEPKVAAKPASNPPSVHVWKQVSSSESTYLGNGWPTLGPQNPSGVAKRAKEEVATDNVYELDLAAAIKHLSPDEIKQIEMALRESETTNDDLDCKPSASFKHETKEQNSNGLSVEDSLAIADALRQAEEEEIARRIEDEKRSLEVALMMQREEDKRINSHSAASRPKNQGNVRTISREEFASQRYKAEQPYGSAYDDHDDDPDEFVSDGFRMNTVEEQKWSRVNRDVVIGPDRMPRTKHDAVLNGKSNAYRLGLEEGLPSISNTTYNSFMKSTKSVTKGVASSGVGRAGRDSSGTKSGALDEHVRLIASKAINRGFINKMNGVVNEGKEAVVYHAEPGPESDGRAVAVKVFKRIQEFRSRGEYVDGDPRYRTKFSDVGAREQLEIWAEKEFRNLVRANAAGIVVPYPLWTKENVVFMRFIGDIRPCPQIRELDLHHGSKRWTKLYENVVDSIERLYHEARLVHGDLSEYNILVAPAKYIDSSESTDILPVFIDFAQAVDIRHPESNNYLARDVHQVLSFFSKVGVSTDGTQDIIDRILNL